MITIIKPGLHTTIQDLGRLKLQKYGVVVSGAMDPFAHRMANILVGNPQESATLETTMHGPTIRFHKEAIISICGGDSSPTINGKSIPLWRPIAIKKGDILRLGHIAQGCRSYIGIGGGISVPLVLNSRSTYVRGKLGGFEGRALKTNDQIPIGPLHSLNIRIQQHLVQTGIAQWKVPIHTVYSNHKIRVVKGRQYPLFTLNSQQAFFQTPYKITSNSDRMGYRLDGAPLFLVNREELLSEAVTFGTVQVTSDGKPVILMADRQTTGGYPKLAEVISVDLPILAQKKPGDTVYFEEVSLEKAQQLLRERENFFTSLKRAVDMKCR
jgi:antagonist of KipI